MSSNDADKMNPLLRAAARGDAAGVAAQVLALTEIGNAERETLIRIFCQADQETALTQPPHKPRTQWLTAAEAAIAALVARREGRTLMVVAAFCKSFQPESHLAGMCLDAIWDRFQLEEIWNLVESELQDSKGAQHEQAIRECAVILVERLAEAGYEAAYLFLADLLADGVGVPRTKERGAEWWYWLASVSRVCLVARELGTLKEIYEELITLRQQGGSRCDQPTLAFLRHQADIARDFSRRIFALVPGQEIESLVSAAESQDREFKSTLRWDLKEDKVNHALEDGVVKTVAAFSNASGGVLLIGVGDDGTVIGLQEDFESFVEEKNRNADGFERHLRQLFGRLDGYAPARVHLDFVPLRGHMVCRVLVGPSPVPVWLPGRRFFVRDGNASRPLDGDQVTRYLRDHFKTEPAGG